MSELERILSLSREALESALRELDEHCPPDWDLTVEHLCAELHSRDRERRRAAAGALLHVAGGRVGAAYSVVRKPRLERPPVWSALLTCCQHSDNVLRKDIGEALKYCLHHAGAAFPTLLPALLELLTTDHRRLALDILAGAAGRGCDITSAVPRLMQELPAAASALVFEALNRGDVDGAERLLEQSGQPATITCSMGYRMGDGAHDAIVALLTRLLGHPIPDVRVYAAQALGQGAAPSGAMVEALLALLSDKATLKPSGKVADFAAVALARLSARDTTGACGVLPRLVASRSKKPTREAAAFASMGSAILRDDPGAAFELLEDAASDLRRGALTGVSSMGPHAGEALALRLLERLARLREEDPPKALVKAIDGALDVMVRRASRLPRGAQAIHALAMRRWAQAAELSVYDDVRVVDAVLDIAHQALRSDARHVPSLVLVTELYMERKDLPRAAATLATLLELEPDEPEHRRKQALIEAGDGAAAQRYVESERLPPS